MRHSIEDIEAWSNDGQVTTSHVMLEVVDEVKNLRKVLSSIADFNPMDHSGCGSSADAISGYKSYLAEQAIKDAK